MTLNIDDYKVIKWTVSKGIEDYFWVLKAKIDKHTAPAFFEKLKATAVDHQGVRRTPFIGIIPAIDYTLKTAADKANLIGYDHAWYLTVQHIPTNLETIDIDQNPARTVAALLGGTDWEKTTGIEPYRMNNVTAWDDATDPIKKEFTFKEKTLRWSAIIEIADYCNYVFVVKWRELPDGTMRPCAYFVHEDDIDTEAIGLDLPGEMTVDAPDKYLMHDVTIKDEKLYKFNRVLCVGFNQATDEYFYSTAQTPEVAAGTELPREYTYTDASLNTADKTETKAQQLLEDFQASSIIYKAKFKHRMDLELYQTLSIGGYPEIDSSEMRIIKITYRRRAADDTVEIEFCKNQAVQQLKRLQRIMKTRIHYETLISDMWEQSGAYAQLIESRPINFQGWGAYNLTTIYGAKNADMGLWGWDTENERGREFLRWRNHLSNYAINRGIEIKENLIINNDPTGTDNIKYPKIYFDIEQEKETYIRGVKNNENYGLDLTAGGSARGAMLSLINPVNEEAEPYILLKRKVYATTDLTVAGTIKAWQTGESFTDLTFYDNRTGTKTLSDLAGTGLWVESTIEGEDFAQLKLDKAINMQVNRIRNLEHPEYDRDAATKYWCEQNFGAGSHEHSANDITSGVLPQSRGGTGNNYGDADSVGGYSLKRLTGNPASFPANTCRTWSWTVSNVKAVIATPDLSYESSPDCGDIVAYVTKQEESNNAVKITVFNGSGTTQYIGVRAMVFRY